MAERENSVVKEYNKDFFYKESKLLSIGPWSTAIPEF